MAICKECEKTSENLVRNKICKNNGCNTGTTIV